MKPMDMMEALGYFPEEDIIEELAYEVPKKRTTFLVSKPFLAGISAAACLLVTVGLSLGIWAKQPKIETRPLQETTTMTQTTAAQTEQQTSAPTSEAGAASSDTVVSSASESEWVRSSETLPPTTAPGSETAVSMQTHEQVVPTIPQTTAQTPLTDAPVTGTPVQTTAVPESSETTAETQSPATPQSTETTQFFGTTTTCMATETNQTLEPPKIDYDILPGFSVTELDDGAFLEVTWLSDVPASPEETVSYHLESDRFVLEFAGKVTSHYEYWYDIYDNETGQRVRVRMEKRRIFQRTLNGGGELSPAFVNGNPGFLYLREQQCILCWDNGCYECIIYADAAAQEILLPIAEAMYPDE